MAPIPRDCTCHFCFSAVGAEIFDPFGLVLQYLPEELPQITFYGMRKQLVVEAWDFAMKIDSDAMYRQYFLSTFLMQKKK